MKVGEAVKLLLKEDQESDLKVMVHGMPGFQQVQRLATYKENGISMTIMIINEPPAIVEKESCTSQSL